MQSICTPCWPAWSMYLTVRSVCASRIFSMLSSTPAASEVWMSPHFTIRGMTVLLGGSMSGKLTINVHMKTFALFLLVFCALTSGLLADVTLAPAAPKAGEAFDIRIEGVWRDSCVPADPRL